MIESAPAPRLPFAEIVGDIYDLASFAGADEARDLLGRYDQIDDPRAHARAWSALVVALDALIEAQRAISEIHPPLRQAIEEARAASGEAVASNAVDPDFQF
jgi:hypothetical protein